MTMLIRGAALSETDLTRGSLLDLADDKPATLGGLDLVPAHRGEFTATLDLDALATPGSFCEIELASGARVWLRPDELAGSRYFELTTTRGQVELVPRRGLERGLADLAVRVLKVFKVDPLQLAGNLAREKVISFIERNVKPQLVLLGSGPSDLQSFEQPVRAGDKSWLLMLHGTFSSTRGSFGGLQTANGGEDWRRLSEHFGPRMLSLEHHTVSVSPLENAIKLVQDLPAGIRLHLLSHSRGGLIGELLCRRDGQAPGFAARELDVLDALDATLAKDARKLDALLRDKALVVERFVRVACPARGTTLASERGREWLTVFVNVLAGLTKKGSDAALGATGFAALMPVARSAIELLQALTLETIKISAIPGLRAMDPGSNFIRGLINSEHAKAADSLAVIAGDSEGSGVFGRLKMFAVDTFFERDNDLVVDTDSMIGGAQRTNAFRLLVRGEDISHFSYFGGPRTAAVISKALTLSELAQINELQKFEINQHALRAPLRTPSVRRDRRDLPIVFLLPGIMGTQLKVDGETVWADHWALVRGGFARLGADAAGIELGALDGDTYQSLADALAADHEVVPFAYDWRLPIEDAARRLNDAVRTRIKDALALKRPIRFVAHSMGGLVVRAMMMLPNSVWPALQALPDRRFVMLGTPNQGSHAISLMLTGNDRLVQLLALGDLRNSLHEIVGIAADFPGALDMAPATEERDYFSQQAWADLATAKQNPGRWPLPSQVELDRSRAFRQRLAKQDLAGLDVYYIAGQAKDTPVRADLDLNGGQPKLTFIATREGDGRVPWASGIPNGVKAWYVPAKHGRIPDYRPLHPALRDILNHGSTVRLPTAPPVGRDLPGALRAYPQPRINMLPAEDDLISAALDREAEPIAHAAEPLPAIDVEVVWGNLRYAKHLVVVGHYIGDMIVSAEAALDVFLEQALSRRLALGRYPGDVGTALVIPNARGELPGAVVVGLGQVSTRLTRSDLARAVQTGVSEWAARMLESKPSNGKLSDGATAARGLAFVAVGSGQGGMPLSDVGSAILEGVQQALELLSGQRGSAEVHRLGLSRIQFLELYEDRAHTLWHGLASRARNGVLTGCFRLADTGRGVAEGKDGRRRLVLREADDWWTPLKITQQGNRLLFENIGDRARAELRGVGTHASQIDDLLRQAVDSRETDHRLCRALFSMLIPNDLKHSLPAKDSLRLLLDHSTARYPWELILAGQSKASGTQDGRDESAGNGVIRQFVTARFRPNPRMARAATALVVGDPETGKTFPALPGALEEAQAVHATLAELGYTLPAPVLREARSILIEMHAQPYQFLHLAGHGIEDLRAWLLAEGDRLNDEIEQDGPSKSKPQRAKRARLLQLRHAREELLEEDGPVSAMVIGAQQFLTYRNIEQMNDVPELVFINCCHLGRIAQAPDSDNNADLGRPSATAAGFAQKFIEIGVRAVIAAGWPVDDAAAVTFADAFYRALHRGEALGDAVRDARAQTRALHPDSNTWAAYQCYGDPSFRPTSADGQTAGWQPTAARYGSPRHLAFEGVQTARNLKILRDHVAYADQHGFATDGELCSAIADAYRDFEALPEAINWYRKALADEQAHMPLRAIERLLNLIVRAGQTLAGQGQRVNPAWLRQVDEVIGLFERVNHEGATQERHSLIGSAHKRKAMALTGKPRLKALHASAAAYRAAVDLAQHGTSPYPFINAAVMLAAVGWAEASKLPTADIKSLLQAAQERVAMQTGSEFWDFAVKGDLLIARIFAADLPPTEANSREALKHFADAFERDGKKGNLASVVDQVRLMETVLGSLKKSQTLPVYGSVSARISSLLNDLSATRFGKD